MSNLESVSQQTLVAMLRAMYPDLVINLSLNGISLTGLSPQQKAQLIREQKLQGFTNGIMDLVIYLPNAQVLNLELKRPKGGSQSTDQLVIQAKLEALGHNYFLIRDIYDVFKLIAERTSIEFRRWQYGTFTNSPAFKLFPQIEHLYQL
jgi:hypothetical protein